MKLSGKTIAVLVAVVVAGAAAVAIGTSGGGNSDGDSSLQQYQPVTVAGEPLTEIPESGPDSAVGSAVPALSGFDFAGTAVSLDVAASKTPTMVVFLAHWCPHCNREVPRILELDGLGGIPAGLRVVAVATGSRRDFPNWPPSQWIKEIGWKWEVMTDSKRADAFRAYGGSGFPMFAFVEPDGKLWNRIGGEVGVVALDGLIKTFMESASRA